MIKLLIYIEENSQLDIQKGDKNFDYKIETSGKNITALELEESKRISEKIFKK